MQDAALEHWASFDKQDSFDLEDFGFWSDWETVASMGSIYVLSGYRTLPRAGGWLDQDANEADDLITYVRGLAWMRAQNKDTTAVKLPDRQGKDWTDL